MAFISIFLRPIVKLSTTRLYRRGRDRVYFQRAVAGDDGRTRPSRWSSREQAEYRLVYCARGGSGWAGWYGRQQDGPSNGGQRKKVEVEDKDSYV